MAEDMKNAWKGQGGGLQGAATAVGDMMTSETQAPSQQKSQAASDSLTDMASGNKKTGQTVEGTKIKAADQIANQQTGTADHLDRAFRK